MMNIMKDLRRECLGFFQGTVPAEHLPEETEENLSAYYV